MQIGSQFGLKFKEVKMATLIQLRRDTKTNWEQENPVLQVGEAGYETDTEILKIGDGITAWNALRPTYANGDIQIITLLQKDWIGATAPYSQEIEIDLMQESFNPNVGLICSEDYNVALVQLQEYSKLYKGVSGEEKITFYASSPPKCDLTLRVKRL